MALRARHNTLPDVPGSPWAFLGQDIAEAVHAAIGPEVSGPYNMSTETVNLASRRCDTLTSD
jgi:hypothetical protein